MYLPVSPTLASAYLLPAPLPTLLCSVMLWVRGWRAFPKYGTNVVFITEYDHPGKGVCMSKVLKTEQKLVGIVFSPTPPPHPPIGDCLGPSFHPAAQTGPQDSEKLPIPTLSPTLVPPGRKGRGRPSSQVISVPRAAGPSTTA